MSAILVEPENRGKGSVTAVETTKPRMGRRRQPHIVMICDMIRLQIRLRAVLLRLARSPQPKARHRLHGAQGGN